MASKKFGSLTEAKSWDLLLSKARGTFGDSNKEVISATSKSLIQTTADQEEQRDHKNFNVLE